jgi:hypothetical protein
MFEFLNLHIWRRNDFHLEFFFSLVDIEDGKIFQNQNLKTSYYSLLTNTNADPRGEVQMAVQTGAFFYHI